MKKNIIIIAAIGVMLSATTIVRAQTGRVGINTDIPNATLDVAGVPADITKTDGLIAPRLKGSELKAKDALYTAPQTGAIVYVNEALLPAATTAKTVNVTAVGYFYFDGVQWVALKSGGAGGAEPWRVQNTATEATANTQNIYQAGKVAVGTGFDAAVSGYQFEVAGGYRMQTSDGTSTFGTMSTDASKAISTYSGNATNTALTSLAPATILNSIVKTGQSNIFHQMYDDGHFDFYGTNSTTDSNWEMYGKIGADGEDHLRFKHRQASGSGDNRWSSEIFLNKTLGNSFKFYTNTGIQGNYIFPRTNGTAGQVLMTDGAVAATGAQLYWGTPAGETNDWHITGNAGTTAGTNFLGTTDDVDLVFKRNNVVSGVLKSTSTSYGVGSLPLTSTGDRNSAFGLNALSTNTTGSANTAFGIRALMDNTTGGGNTAFGVDALANNQTGLANVAIGSVAGNGIVSGSRNISIGNRTMSVANGVNDNTAIGHDSLLGLTTGNSNTAVGNTSGANITTGSNNTTIGSNAGVPSATGSNQVRIGNTAVTYAGVQVAWTVTSDRRLKDNIKDSNLGLNFINQLRPVSYVRKNDESKKPEYGFIAQELQETLKNNGVTSSGIVSEADDSTLSVRYNDLFAPLVKAVQEQQKLIEDQQAMILKLQQKVDELAKK
ncbi:tail fiber domain-containing protein [Epilithonimonas mollis]|uniref:Chaperone of endosialidase n=1 Tax=Epilithonimonas mollis TaxID=216903 RepID=A0A1M6NPH8_9FLAO|nr:tail fiber domain-containing protein [Epilithonimonas mollis]SHJ97472.1 Chaperone of endosialidase [Epilithonimonas mollis]